MLEKLKDILGRFNIKKLSDIQILLSKAKVGLFIILVSYAAASMFGAIVLPFILAPTVTSAMGKAKDSDDEQVLVIKDRPNLRDAEKSILHRNIFNNTGEFPDEKLDDEGSQAGNVFDANAPCNKTSMSIVLVGTIYLGNERSMAIIKESGFDTPDTYTEGEQIIGFEPAYIHSIGRNKVVINNNGVKECLELKISKYALDDDEDMPIVKKEVSSVGGSESHVLQASWVEAELGDGFGNIQQAARLIPNDTGDKIGFKMFSIRGGCLFDKIGLKDNDIIVQVNSTVLEASQGFSVYQAFLDEKEVTLRILRQGEPRTINVTIK